MCSGNVASSERNPDSSEDCGFSVGRNSLTRFADLTVKVIACVMVGQATPCVKKPMVRAHSHVLLCMLSVEGCFLFSSNWCCSG